MPRGNLYSAYKAAGSTAGKYQGSWYAQQGIQGERAAESMISDVKVEGIQQTTAAITEGLGLVSNIYEGYKSKKEMATAAKGLGAVEQEQGFMDWFMGGEKEYELGGDIFTGTQVKARYESELYGTNPFKKKSKVTKKEKRKSGKSVDPSSIEEKPEPLTMAEEVDTGPRGDYEGLDFLQDKRGIFQEGSMTEKAKSLLGKVALGGAAVGAVAAAPSVAAGVAGAGAAGYGLYRAGKAAIGIGKAAVGAGKGVGRSLIGAGKSAYQALKDIDMPSKPKKTMAAETDITTDKERLEIAAEKGYDTSAGADLLEQGKVKEDLPKGFIGPPETTLETSVKSAESLLESVPEYRQGRGLTAKANEQLYAADPSMEGKSAEERIKRYEELFGGMKFTP